MDLRPPQRWLVGFAVFVLVTLAWTCAHQDDAGAPDDVPDGALATAADSGRSGGDPPTARRETLDALREAHEAPRHASDGGGRAWLELADGESRTVPAGGHKRWTIVYEAGELGVAEGGFVRLTVPRFWNWSPAQTTVPSYPGYTTVSTDADGVQLEAVTVPEFWVDFVVRGRALASGERIRIVYGAGEALAVADRYAERESALWISVDGDGDGIGAVLVDSPTVDVVPGPPRTLRIVLPSTREPGESFQARISVLDITGSASVEIEGELVLATVPDGLAVPAQVALTPEDGGVLSLELEAPTSGVYRILGQARIGNVELEAISNPMLVEPRVAPIRWGDLHGHSNLSDGTGTPEDFLRYARDVAGLDVVSLTDHDHWGMLFLDEHPELWEEIKDVTERFHDPGRFVTVLGYEWTNWVHGHRHVLYFEDDGPVHSAIDPDYETPQQLWDALRGLPAMTFAHHSAGGPVATNWDFAPPPELEPVTEVASVHGSSEAMDAPMRIYSPLEGNFVRDVLDRGYQLGFIGSADSHDGHPGFADISSPSGSGLAALLTDDLTRDGVRQALLERRSYATNGARIILRMAVDAHRMGATIAPTPADETALFYMRAIGTAPIAQIDVVRSGEILTTIDGEGVWYYATTIDLEPLESGEYVYVRVVQQDRKTAWSSPVFVE